MMKEKYLMFNDYILDKVLGKTEEMIGTEKFDNTNIFIDADDKLWNDIILKYILILITCVITDDNKFYLQLLLEEALFVK